MNSKTTMDFDNLFTDRVTELCDINSNEVEHVTQNATELPNEWWTFSSSEIPRPLSNFIHTHFISSTALQSNLLKTKIQQGAGKVTDSRISDFTSISTAKILLRACFILHCKERLFNQIATPWLHHIWCWWNTLYGHYMYCNTTYNAGEIGLQKQSMVKYNFNVTL